MALAYFRTVHMPQTHHIRLTRLSAGVDTRALWAIHPTGNLLVFVHGFGGKSVGTWSHFPALLQGRTQTAEWDAVFFGYDGLHTPAAYSAATLREFLKDFETNAASHANQALDPSHQRDPFIYQRIAIIGHSLGSIVSREAMCQGLRGSDTWPDKCCLFLFAPAHTGADVILLVRETLPGSMTALAQSVAQLFGKFKVLKDLVPGSNALVALKLEVENQLRTKRKSAVTAKLVVHANDDRVVRPEDFIPEDEPLTPVVATHTSVCKPEDAFLKPLLSLLTAVSRCHPS
jgi:pimeloyl-ACP methyl ester carboxylesterase